MAYIERDGDTIVARTDFTERELIKQVPGFKWNPQAKVWIGPLSWASCQVMRGVFGERLQIGPALADWANAEYRDRIYPCLVIREKTSGDTIYDPRLRPWQNVDVEFMSLAQQCLIGNEMGTGKTPVAVRAVERLYELHSLGAGHPNPYPVLTICPNSTKSDTQKVGDGWEGHWNGWADDVKVFVIGKNKPKMFRDVEVAIAQGHKVVVVINWEAVRLHSRLAPYGTVRLKRCVEHGGEEEKVSLCEVHNKELNNIKFGTVIADEAHKQKDPKSKQTRAVWAVQHAATFRFSLTGTPLANHPGDLWAIMHGVAPLEYPTRTKYNDRYCLMSFNPFGGLDIVGVRPDTRDEYFRILDPRFRRMPKDLVLPDLPDKVRVRRHADMNPKQTKAYREIEGGMVTRLDDGRLVVSTNNLTQQTRLLQFSSCYAEVNDEGQVRLTEPSSKIDVLLEILDEMGGKPCVVAAESRQLIDLACARLEKAKITWRVIEGGQTSDQRDAAKADFMNGQARVLLFTIKAGGTGLNLTGADTIVFLQRSWSMLENKQAEDRVHRIGAEKHESITILDIVAPNTVEEDQILRLYEKAARLEEIVRDKQLLRNAAANDPDAARRLAIIEAEEDSILNSDLTGRELLQPLEAVPT